MSALLLVVSLVALAALMKAPTSSRTLEPIRLPVEDQRQHRRPRR